MFGVFYISLERSIRGVHIFFEQYHAYGICLGVVVPRKCHLGPQNNPESLGPKKS
jgi:hypothetical protein